jgi:hypothetical protein
MEEARVSVEGQAMKALRFAAYGAVALLLSTIAAVAQRPPTMPSAPAPILNPSGPSVVPQPPPVPVSPATPGPAPGSNLAGTSQVANPHRSVFHTHRPPGPSYYPSRP